MQNFSSQPLKMDEPEISLVIPCYNEEGNLRKLIESILAAVEPMQIPHEIVVTDDCSQDRSWEILKELAANDSRIRVQKFSTNRGKSAAGWAGMKIARGRYIVTLDADLQNDPKDLPKLLEALKIFDCANGTRVESRKHGDNFVRIVSSRFANWVRNKLSGRKYFRRGMRLPRFQARMHRRLEALRRHAPIYAHPVQDGGVYRH